MAAWRKKMTVKLTKWPKMMDRRKRWPVGAGHDDSRVAMTGAGRQMADQVGHDGEAER